MIKIFLNLTILLAILNQSNAITQYDFNVCRIDFCQDKEEACVSDEAECMEGFSKTRKW